MTRFRAYKMDTIGDSFSYFDGKFFTLIEARYNDVNKSNIREELGICNKTSIDTLHITSWDNDHCAPAELEELLKDLKPTKIEYPGYEPHTESGEKSLEIIGDYKQKKTDSGVRNTTTDAKNSDYVEVKKVKVNPEYITSLKPAKDLTRNDIIYWPKEIKKDEPNNCSIVKLFRSGSFNVLSTGDIESHEIAQKLSKGAIFKDEIDVLILAHHGANNGFTTAAFLDAIRPKVAICGADWGNKFEHPKEEIRNLLKSKEIPLHTTKNGDVIIYSKGGDAVVKDLITDGEKVRDSYTFKSKKSRIEALPDYAIRDHYRKTNTPMYKGITNK